MTAPSLTRLLEKYDVPVPRYTSYPAVPNWQQTPSPDEWSAAVEEALRPDSASLAIYVHLPFCEVLCTFCGCNTVITRNRDRGAPYVDTVLAELDLYLSRVPVLPARPVAQLHLGGGTPTFMPPEVLTALLQGLSSRLPLRAAEYEGSVEVDPRVTTPAHLDAMRRQGLSRISLGVQDIDDEVMRGGARQRLRVDQLRLDLRPPGADRLVDGAPGRGRARAPPRSPRGLQLRARAVDQAGATEVHRRTGAGRRREARALRGASRIAAWRRVRRARPRSFRVAA
jgi:hypothetical protein